MKAFDFDKPSRQSNYAIILIIFKLYKNWIKRFLPILIAVSVSAENAIIIWLTIASFVILVGIFGIVAFFKYTFYLTGNELIINKGVFKRSKMIIPFERIQSINFKQTIIHQIFSVVELEIDTAGSAHTEFDLRAISFEKAEALRKIILASRQTLDIQPEETTDTPSPVQKRLFKLTFWELVKVGLTQNHLKSGLIPIGLYFWLRDMLHSGGIELDEIATEYANPDEIIRLGLIIIGVLFLGYALIAILISLFLSILRFFELTFFRTEDGFKVSYGLLTKRQISIKDSKIQIFHWSDNLLRKIPRIHNMQIKQAASKRVKQKTSSIHLVGLSTHHIHQFLDAYFTEHSYQVDDFIGLSPWWIKRQMVIYAILLTIFGSLAFFLPDEPSLLFICLFLIFLMLNSYLYFRKKKFGVNDEVIYIKGGHFGDAHELIQLHKIQGIQLNRSPFQKRKNLATIVIFTAAGTTRIPYIPYDSAVTLRDYVLQIVETDLRDWM